MNGKRRAQLGLMVLSAAMVSPLAGSAQSYYWTGTDGVEGGAGSWGRSSESTQLAWKRNNAGSLVTWPVSASSAVFAGSAPTGNTVSLVEDVNLSAMLFTVGSSGGGGAYTLRQGTAGAEIGLTSGATITSHNREALISAPLFSSGGFILTQKSDSTYGKLQLENAAGTNRFGGDITVIGTSATFGTLFRVLDDYQLSSAVASGGKASVILQGGAQFGSSSDRQTTTISSPVRIGNALAGQPYGGALVGSYQAGNTNTTYSGGLLGSGGTGSLLIRPVDNNHTITLAGAGTFDRGIVLYNSLGGSDPRSTTLIVTASNALGAGNNNAESAWTDIGVNNTLKFSQAGTWTYEEKELLALRAASGAVGSAVEVTGGDLTFNGGLALVRGATLSGVAGGGGVNSTRYPSVNVASGASIRVLSAIRDSGTGTASGWRKIGAGTLVLPHASTFAQQQFTFGGELGVPYIDRTSQPLGANGDAKNFLDDTASLWVKYDKSVLANGSTIRFFNDLPEPTLLARENNESMLVAGVGVLDKSDNEGRRKGVIEIGPGLDLTQTGANGSGSLRVWHLTDSEYNRPGNVANIDAFVRVAPTSTYRINSIQTIWQTNSGDDDSYLGGGAPSTKGEVNTVFGGGGTIHINGVTSNTTANFRLNMLVADATTLITRGASGTASSAERGFGFIGDHAAFGSAGEYVSPILRVEAGSPSPFASAIVLRKVNSEDTLSAVIDTPFLSTAESAKVDGNIANVTDGFVTLTKQGSGRLDVGKVLLSNGGAASGDINLVGGAIRVHGTDGLSRVSNLTVSGARFEMVPETGLIIDGSTTRLADVRNAVLSGWNDGTWNGQGIALAEGSSRWRIGYAVAGVVRASNDLSFMSGAGTPSSLHAVEATDLLIRAVYAGDTNLDGTVSFDDLRTLAENYGLKDKVWSDGELTYSSDGRVDFDDLLLLAQTYGLGSELQHAGTPGDLAVYLELQAGAPWILNDVLSRAGGHAVFESYLNGEPGLGSGYVTHLQDYNLTNNLVPEPSSLTALSLIGAIRWRR